MNIFVNNLSLSLSEHYMDLLIIFIVVWDLKEHIILYLKIFVHLVFSLD